MIDQEILGVTTPNRVRGIGRLGSKVKRATDFLIVGLLVPLFLGVFSSSGQIAGKLDGYNVLLITIDTLRADRLGVYGYDGVQTPNIDRLAVEGIRFEQVTTTVPATLPAHASIMTGLQPFEHGVRSNGAFMLRDDVKTLAEQFVAAGYVTGAFIGTVVLDAQFGIAQGFEKFDGLAPYQRVTEDMSGERPGESVVEEASMWIRSQSTPFFAWVHMYDPHDPYDAPEPFGSRYANSPYDGEVAYVDAMVGQLRQVLEESSAADNTLIVLTSDHGEGLGDHGEQTHSFFIYDSTVRVPLIFWAPGEVPGGIVAMNRVGVIDIFPTVLTMAGLPIPSNSGVDLSRHFSDQEWFARAIYSESLIPYLDFGWSELRALIDGNYKYIAAPEPELYDLEADPGETKNLVNTDTELAAMMHGALQKFVSQDDVSMLEGEIVDAESLAALQALGYLSGRGGGRDRRDTDPKSMIETHETFVRGLRELITAIEQKRFADVDKIFAQLDELIPDEHIVYYVESKTERFDGMLEEPEAGLLALRLYFGQLAFKAGDIVTSVDFFERALERNSSYLPAYGELANVLYAAGDLTGAQDLIVEALGISPGNFSLTLLSGVFHHDSGNLNEALKAYHAAERMEPNHPELLERLAHLYLLLEQPSQAVDVLRRLSQAAPDAAAVWAQLAFALAQIGETNEAQQAITRALEIDPNDVTVRQVARLLR